MLRNDLQPLARFKAGWPVSKPASRFKTGQQFNCAIYGLVYLSAQYGDQAYGNMLCHMLSMQLHV